MLSFPGKTFLFGEYAVLEKASALLIATPPLFTAAFREASRQDGPFHPESLAGRFWRKESDFFRHKKLEFTDPYSGAGGLGASGAEFLSLYFRRYENHPALAPKERAFLAWECFQDLNAEGKRQSGADVLVQAYAMGREDSPLLLLDIEKRELREILFKGFVLSLFHTGRKLATHEHLKKERPSLNRLIQICRHGAASFSENAEENGKSLVAILNATGKELECLSLVADSTRHWLEELRKQEQLLAAKGCGAMGADVICALSREPLETPEGLRKIFEKRL